MGAYKAIAKVCNVLGAHLHVFTTNNRCNRGLFPKLYQWWTIYSPPFQCRLFWELVDNLFLPFQPHFLLEKLHIVFFSFFFFILLQPTFPLKGLNFIFYFLFFNALPIFLSFGMGE
jgi:hypothetical protein